LPRLVLLTEHVCLDAEVTDIETGTIE